MRLASKSSKMIIASPLLTLFLISAFCFFVNLTRLRRLGLASPPLLSLVENDAGVRGVLITTPSHPPWSQAHIVHAEIDVESKRIRICRYYFVWHPFSESLYVGPAIALTNIPEHLNYEIEYWDGNDYVVLGKLFSGSKDQEMKWMSAVPP